MGLTTKIQWCHHTFNPWRGCAKVSPGCANCYAEKQSKRNPKVLGEWGANGTRIVASESMWRQPLVWNRAAEKAGERHRVFCASLADVFEDRPELVSPRLRLLRLIGATPHLDWLLLTKRPENVALFLHRIYASVSTIESKELFASWKRNVWLGVSVEDQQRGNERILHLLRTLATIRFLSVEPLLAPVDLCLGQRDNGTLWERHLLLDWVIVGGESGPNARSCNVEWIRRIVRQCREAGVACFVKQLGSNITGLKQDGLDHDKIASLLGSTYRLRDSKGGDPSEWPEDLRVREFPSVGGLSS